MSGVVITGLGTVGAYGCGGDSLRRALAAADPSALPALASDVDRSAGYHRAGGARCALLTRGVSLAEWLAPGEARRMSPPSKLAVAAARMALVCAGFPDRRSDREETAVAIATAFGPSSYSEALLRQILFEGPEATSPFLFTESVANAPAAQIAILCRARGPSMTICQREASALQALGQGAADVASGRAPRALAGAVDEMTPLLHALLDRFGALARPVDGEEAARPFDRRRHGFVAAEGATVLLLETAASAAERGAHPLARVLAWGSAFDATAPQAGWGTGHERLARSLRRGLERSGVDLQEIDLIVSGASGSRGGDRLEALMLRDVFSEKGASLPPILAPKRVLGEYGGGFLGAAVLAASGATMPPLPASFEPDPELGIVPDPVLPGPPSTILVTTLAAGGAASWLLLGAPGEP